MICGPVFEFQRHLRLICKFCAIADHQSRNPALLLQVNFVPVSGDCYVNSEFLMAADHNRAKRVRSFVAYVRNGVILNLDANIISHWRKTMSLYIIIGIQIKT